MAFPVFGHISGKGHGNTRLSIDTILESFTNLKRDFPMRITTRTSTDE